MLYVALSGSIWHGRFNLMKAEGVTRLWVISGMWHESRRQEKLVKGIIIDYQKRAERRKDHYEKMKSDPLQLLRITGTSCKLHINPSVSNNECSVLVSWQGDGDIMISRFDVRAHLDYIPDLPPKERPVNTELESRSDYERYRKIIYNTFKCISQEKALAEINIEESYPISKPIHSEKKSSNKTAIAYQYDKATQLYATKPPEATHESAGDTSSDEVLSEIGNELHLSALDRKQLDSLDEIAIQFGLNSKEFSHYHRSDLAEHKLLKEELFLEKQKSITKSKGSTRKERRALKMELKSKLPDVPYRPSSPLSFACRQSPTYRNRDRSDSSSPEAPGRIEYITEFGSVPRIGDRLKKRNLSHSSLRHRRSRSRDRHREKYRRQRWHSSSRSRSRSRSRERHYKHSRYTRARSRSSSSVSEVEKPPVKRNSIVTSNIKKKDDQSKVTHFEKMQQRMQNKISKQLKQDHKAEQAKLRAKVAVQEDRENDIRGQMRRWRDKERVIREDDNYY